MRRQFQIVCLLSLCFATTIQSADAHKPHCPGVWPEAGSAAKLLSSWPVDENSPDVRCAYENGQQLLLPILRTGAANIPILSHRPDLETELGGIHLQWTLERVLQTLSLDGWRATSPDDNLLQADKGNFHLSVRFNSSRLSQEIILSSPELPSFQSLTETFGEPDDHGGTSITWRNDGIATLRLTPGKPNGSLSLRDISSPIQTPEKSNLDVSCPTQTQALSRTDVWQGDLHWIDWLKPSNGLQIGKILAAPEMVSLRCHYIGGNQLTLHLNGKVESCIKHNKQFTSCRAASVSSPIKAESISLDTQFAGLRLGQSLASAETALRERGLSIETLPPLLQGGIPVTELRAQENGSVIVVAAGPNHKILSISIVNPPKGERYGSRLEPILDRFGSPNRVTDAGSPYATPEWTGKGAILRYVPDPRHEGDQPEPRLTLTALHYNE